MQDPPIDNTTWADEQIFLLEQELAALRAENERLAAKNEELELSWQSGWDVGYDAGFDACADETITHAEKLEKKVEAMQGVVDAAREIKDDALWEEGGYIYVTGEFYRRMRRLWDALSKPGALSPNGEE